MERVMLRIIMYCILWNRDEFTTIAFYSLQSGINVIGDWVLLSK